MTDPRLTKLADILVNYATRVKPGDKLLIEDFGVNTALVCELVSACYRAGGTPEVQLHDQKVDRALQMGATKEGLEWLAGIDGRRMSDCAA